MYKKTGYLAEDLRLFHLCDKAERHFLCHYHDFDKITLFLQGEAAYEIEGKQYALQPFDIVLVRAGQLHRPLVSGAAPYERVIAYMSPHFFTGYAAAGYDLNAVFAEAAAPVLRQGPEIGSLYGASCRLRQAWTDTGEYSPLLQQTVFLEFLIHLARAVKDKKIGFIKTGKENEKIREIITYIHSHLTDTLSVSAVAAAFYISNDYLMHLFKETTGYTLNKYITLKRLLLAKRLMAEGLPLTTVCYDSGFRNYSTFYRAWKETFRQSPRQGLPPQEKEDPVD